MNDKLGDFFETTPPPGSDTPAESPKSGRKKRNKRKPPATEVAPAADAPKDGRRKKRKPRQTPAEGTAATPKRTRKTRQPRSVKIDLAVAVQAMAGLKEDDAAIVAVIAERLNTLPKRSRGRIVAALARMFG